jgi:sirohydrochlorin cobaltochelatase
VVAQLRANLGEQLFAGAYNEFCAPTLEESVEELIKKGATHITVTTTMFTPGGSHSEIEIPQILDHLRPQYPGVERRYTWPFDLTLVANTLAEQVKRFS